MNGIPVRHRVFESLQHHDTDTASEDSALRPVTEGPAVPIRRNHAALAIEVSRAMRKSNRNGAGKSRFTFPVQQTLAREMNRDKPCRASGLHREAGPL
jgi:hypothetical protein